MFSFAVSIGSRLKNWKMKPMCSRRSFVSCVSLSSPIFVSAIQTSPAVGLSRPARMCMSVDLPDPEGPMTAVSSPPATSTETPRRACTAVSPSPYWRVRSWAETTGVAATVRGAAVGVSSTCIPLLLVEWLSSGVGGGPFSITRDFMGAPLRVIGVAPKLAAARVEEKTGNLWFEGRFSGVSRRAAPPAQA